MRYEFDCRPRRLLAAALVAGLTVAAGCSEPAPLPGPEPTPVSGSVVYQGRPAVGFRVALHPAQPWEGAQFAPSATTDAEGKFQIHSYRENDGAPPGEYVVTFTWPQEVSSGDPDDAPRIVDRLRGKFSDPRRSQFSATVESGENMLDPFVLK